MPDIVQSTPVEGPAGRRVRVIHYDDGSIRIRVANAAPMKLAEAYMSGRGEHVILRLDPVTPMTPSGTGELVLSGRERWTQMGELIEHDGPAAAIHLRRITERLRREVTRDAATHANDNAAWGEPDPSDTSARRWDPVIQALLGRYGAQMREVVGAAHAFVERDYAGVDVVARSLVELFETPAAQNSNRIAAGAPRFVAALVANALLAAALDGHHYGSFVRLARPLAKSGYGFALPWALAPEFSHLEALAGGFDPSGRAVLTFLAGLDLGDLIDTARLEVAARRVNVLLALVQKARPELQSAILYAWGLDSGYQPIEGLLQELADPANAEGLSKVVGDLSAETLATFQAHVLARLAELMSLVVHNGRFGLLMDRVDPVVARLFAKATP